MSVFLYYGPSAFEQAKIYSTTKGLPVAPPAGLEGLKTDEAREVVEKLTTSFVGDQVGTLIIGPMDQANDKASDVLLKSLEEYTETVIPILWAEDLEGVRPTIKSRSIPIWSPGDYEIEESYLDIAYSICDSFLEGDLAAIYRDVEDTKKEIKHLVQAFPRIIQQRAQDHESLLVLWSHLRDVMKHSRVTKLGVFSALASAYRDVK